MRRFEMKYVIQVEYDSGLVTKLSAYTQTEYEARVQPFLKDKKVKAVWVFREERFLQRKLLPIAVT